MFDVGLQHASDDVLWEYASENDFILISKDEDFADMILRKPTAKLISVRIGNCRKWFLLDLFRRMWPRIVARLGNGEAFLEIR